MAWRIVVQPNGKYAKFSDVVDNFTDYDMTKDEVFELLAMRNAARPDKIVSSAIRPIRMPPL